VPQHRLREDEIPVEVDVEDAARPGNDLDGIQNCFPFLQDPRDQTGRVRERTSGDAVLDPDTMVRSHRRNPSPAGPHGMTDLLVIDTLVIHRWPQGC
jgi:hypothetical protein